MGLEDVEGWLMPFVLTESMVRVGRSMMRVNRSKADELLAVVETSYRQMVYGGQKVTRPALQKDERYPTGIDPGTKPSLFFKVKSPTSTGLHERSGIVQGTHYIRHASYLTRCCTAAEEICCLIQSYMDLDSSDVDWVDLKVEGVRSARSLIQPSN
ncbi:hypothetical protein POX_b02503 [Penicillium oxalicum]|uniref:Uncharacterized protein n=1 Tax=Penicillium oxalicum (strain 114-2 / CGMCC 5302) TaxID=933388 RepID=S7ZJK9_PENO1|nr:hypothetical protein POX_b02503 [Penicillium oxalicum]EPS30489.1 hypothetical protein PDE_05440 [Penicillium oxalicum 114-2]KAI2792465.1 hypothetical protein POX_b02503 [Penicillium oxalicum]